MNMDPSIAAKNTYIFAEKPAKGGTPAIDSMIHAKEMANNGLVLDNDAKSVMYTARPDE